MEQRFLKTVALIESILQSGTEEAYFEVFEQYEGSIYQVLMIVDWREEDEVIVEYCEKILQTGNLSVETESADNTQGFIIRLHYKDQALIIPYQGEGADRDTTLKALNQILQPDYEIRFCEPSDGSDTLEFIPLPKALWQKLDQKYSHQIDQLFRRFEPESVFFG
ncbi:hypothetical protein GCM10025882_21740 [Acinetobacter gyllenbergii]|uniref:Uncharacterized protein n=1 Tax=Acinetobacter gyllenbergii CIP 110306 = MTCC 11365 TaxID=1217657 RepID=A0A829HIC0_9GAMM|nr:hypothetical protein [Acinetobacter gyllenbergii]EPF87802.1 hypothetical protein F957_01672 [Acinetobacter gyllenbergii CIP 110306 = MTCC 11365]EPH34511.1 hypothetical protein L293_3439 [Acinetobacter gyllenbergii CIP 110306 = MTCC 11365]MCU4582544.1 hypothetical protein [Acinetobacter gyllenbergii]GMA11749.1 hypothetical protein GCM10025882_21740 [Acinetobacter gyllenbergii]